MRSKKPGRKKDEIENPKSWKSILCQRARTDKQTSSTGSSATMEIGVLLVVGRKLDVQLHFLEEIWDEIAHHFGRKI